MRPLRYSINVTLDGCCDHRAGSADEELHRYWAETLAQADALLFGRVTYGLMEAGWRWPEGVRPEGAAEIGDVSWHELMTTDLTAAMKFYQEVFGWQPGQSMDMGPMGRYQIFDRPHGQIGGIMNTPPEMANVPPYWQIYFRVPDVDAAAERIKSQGGKILNGPMDVPGGDRIVNAMDPQGAAFGLHSKKSS